MNCLGQDDNTSSYCWHLRSDSSWFVGVVVYNCNKIVITLRLQKYSKYRAVAGCLNLNGFQMIPSSKRNGLVIFNEFLHHLNVDLCANCFGTNKNPQTVSNAFHLNTILQEVMTWSSVGLNYIELGGSRRKMLKW